MDRILIRVIVLILAALAGVTLSLSTGAAPLTGALVGLAAGVLAVGMELAFAAVEATALLGGAMGFLGGLAAAHLLTLALGLGPAREGLAGSLSLGLTIVLGYLGLAAGARRGSARHSAAESAAEQPVIGPRTLINDKILDTSVIIDGRIADIAETGFLEGTFIIPQFVLRELQHIADSSDTLKRNRGRRGLDILHRIQKKVDLNVEIVETDFPKIREVDGKLIALAKETGAKIITNDFNLNKVAELQGVQVLNINQLANSLKPVVLPGEAIRVQILKEGKEANQGVAYLDDGTMVVVDNARKDIGRQVDVLVTSVLQTTAGRMIFTQLKDELSRNG